MKSITVYPLSNYTFGVKEAQTEQDPSVNARLHRLENEYEQYGMRTTVEGLLIVHEKDHPHVLLLQVANAFFKLPGDHLKPLETDSEGLRNRLEHRLGGGGNAGGEESEWKIGEVVAKWWRPNFEGFMYPYVPAHITEPKEVKKIHVIHLPPKKNFSVPKNMKLVAIPLFELYDNAVRYGPMLAAIPHLLSKFEFVYAT